MTEELIKRLREDDTDPVMLKKAADTIETQAAEIEELRAQLKTVLDREAETHRRHDAKVEALEAENERLKNILRDCDPESMSWLDARDAALGETQ
jgi:FtsZ-binding cell division protein ZapB